MHKFKLSIIFGAVLLLVSSCADESLSPVLTFDKAGKGAYVRLIEETERGINLFDIPGSEYKYSVEFVDVDQGKQVSEYRLDLIYTDADKSDGDNSTGPVNFRTYTASDFETLQSGFIGMTDITVPATELISAAGLTPDQVNPGDRFRIESYVTLEDGSVFGYDNSTAAVNGSAFQGHFRYDLDAACPSSLEGSYEFQGSDFWCDEADAGGTVEVIAKGGGKYSFDDWSLGGYPACYGGVAASWGALEFTDVCNEVSFSGTVDNYGDTWTFTSTVKDNEWSIEWVNTYGESGKAVIINPNGWPFTIK